MRKFITKIYGNSAGFYYKSIVFTTVSLIAAFFNYILYPIAARLLGVSVFGEFSALLALITQVGGIMLAFNIISIFLVTKYGEVDSRKILSSIQKVIIWALGSMALLSIILFPIVGKSLDISSGIDLFIVSLILILNVPIAIWSGFFQGNGELVRVGMFSLVSALLKLLFAVFGSYFYGLTGSLLGILAGSVLGLIVFWLLPGAKPPLLGGLKVDKKEFIIIQPHIKMIAYNIFALVILSVMQIYDLMSIKVIESPENSGQYAGISTLSRVIFYVGFIIIWAILPEIAKATQKHRLRLINKSYLLYGTIALLFIVGSIIAGNFAYSLLLGNAYTLDIMILLWSAIFQTGILLITFQSYSLLVLGNYKVIALLTFNLITMITLTQIVDTTIESLIKSYSLCTIMFSIAFGFMLKYQSKENHE